MNAAAQSSAQASSTSSASAASLTHQSPAHNAEPQPQPIDQGSSTDPFLRDFTLVAEAAKRAQMAVMMRDFESVGI